MRITKLTCQSWLSAPQGGALPHRKCMRGSICGGPITSSRHKYRQCRRPIEVWY
ncbi:hypothetical protein CFP56_025140 [Quercus suber]|uniref:Uncharacterized protein n=1 Tax=Quercus suber TaxID=58331 RepID=A0AAW0K4M5_QUESU